MFDIIRKMNVSRGALLWLLVFASKEDSSFGFRMYPGGNRIQTLSPSQIRIKHSSINKPNIEGTIWRRKSPLFDSNTPSRRRGSSSGYETKNPPSKAPLVDSTLLRFLSVQKKAGAVAVSTNRDEYNNNGNDRRNLSEMESKTTITKNSSTLYSIDGNENLIELQGERNIGNTDANTVSWLTQYNSNIIAQTLISIGADETSALEAGITIQNHVLSKTTRQRMNKFLRDRNAMWADTTNEIGADSTDIADSRSYFDLSNVKRDALLREDSYNFEKVLTLMTGVGLTGKDIATILSHTPSISTMKVLDDMDSIGMLAVDQKREIKTQGNRNEQASSLNGTINVSIHQILSSKLKLRKYDIRKVLRTCPGLLTSSGSKSAEEVITLLSSLGVSFSSIARDKKNLPLLLSRKPSSMFQLVAFLSSDIIRMPVSSIGPFLRRPDSSILLDVVVPVLRTGSVVVVDSSDTAEGRESLSMFSENVKKWNGRYESVVPGTLDRLYNSKAAYERNRISQAYTAMTETAKYLRFKVGVEDLGKLLSACPHVLLFDIESQIAPVVKFLVDEVEMDEEDIPRVLQSCPALVGKDLSALRKVSDYMRSLDVEDESLGSIFRAFPNLLTIDIDRTMVPVVEFLRNIGVSNVGRFITRLPPVLSYSVEKELKPKWEYLKTVSQYYGFEVMRFPAYFSYPLERVIKTRYEYLLSVKGLPVTLIPVDDIVRFGDADFATKIAGDKDNGASFSNFVATRGNGKRRPSKKIKKSSFTKKSIKESLDIKDNI